MIPSFKIGKHGVPRVSRRHVLTSLSALAMSPLLRAQRSEAVVTLRTLHGVTLAVADLQRSLAFYQRLFGMPIQSRHGQAAVVLRVGSGPQFLVLTAAPPGATPSIQSVCLGVDAFDVGRVSTTLEAHGLSPEAGVTSTPGGMRQRVTRRQADRGGAREGTAELFFTGPDNLRVQLQHANYCAGGGALGDKCNAISSATKGVLALIEYNHVAAYSQHSDRALIFYRELFGAAVETLPFVKIGGGPAFLVVAAGGAASQSIGSSPIDHVCLTVRGFDDPEKTTKTLIDFGIQERRNGQAAAPLQTYTRLLRDTVELYVTDPDGLLLQLQDSTYCAGAGRLGNVCS